MDMKKWVINIRSQKICEMKKRSKLQDIDAKDKRVGLKNIVIKSSIKVHSMS